MNRHSLKLGRKDSQKLAAISLAVVFLFSFINPHDAFSSPIFGSQLNLSNNSGTSTNPQIATSGNNVYVVWQDDDTVFNNDVRFKASSDNGTSFGSETNLSNNSTESVTPKIVASGNNVYVVWQDGNNIDFVRSTNNGASFDPAIDLAPSAVSAQVPQIAVSGSSVYVVWQDNGDIFFDRSTDGGASFLGAANISSNAGTSSIPQIATSGNNVYVVWTDNTPGNNEIFFAASSDNGTSFGVTKNLSNSAGFSDLPHVVADANNVYVVWTDAGVGTDIFISSSHDNGASFSAATDLDNNVGFSSNPQLSTNGTNVYVAWNDDTPGNNDIMFKASNDNATSFGSVINLSDNSGTSVTPVIGSNGNFVYVAWQDFTNDPSNGEVLLRSSSDNGATFTGVKNLSNNAGNSGNTIQIATNSDNKLYVVWEDTTPDTLNSPPVIPDILFVAGSASTVDISFDKSQYKISGTAMIVVNDTSSNTNATKIETISPVTVTSTSDSGGIALTMTETGQNTGVFTGNLTFTTGLSSGSTLKAAAGDTITVNFAGQTGFASIFPRTIYFGTPGFPITSYDQGSVASVTVEDQNSNTNSTKAETINVHVTSLANPTGIPLALTETGPDTGVFNNDNLIFMPGNYLFPTTASITVTQTDLNVVGPDIDIIQEIVTSTTDPVGIPLNLTETGNTTSIFTGKIHLSTNPSNSTTRQLQVNSGDLIHFTYASGSVVTNGLITPNPNPTVGAIQTLVVPAAPDTVTATYLGANNVATVDDLYGPGGGGGGIVRAGLIVDVVASVTGGSGSVSPSFSLTNLALVPNANIPANIKNEVLNRDPNVPIQPDRTTQFDFPLIIDGGGYPLAGYSNKIVTVVEKTNTPVDLHLNIPATNLEHLALYTNLHGTENNLLKSDTYIIYDKDQKLQIVDPHHYFDHVKFDMTTTKGVLNKIDYTITFANPMDKSNIIFRTWNDRHASSDVVIQDAWQVTEGPKLTSSSQLAPSQEQNIPIPQTPSLVSPVPSQGTLNIISKIKDWGGFSPNPITDSELLSDIGIQGKDIPNWTQRMSKMVIDGDLTPQEFEDALKYLASIGIVK